MEYYSAIKENIWVNSKEVDEPRKWSEVITLQSEVSQKERKKYIYVYILSLEKWYWWTYLQGRNGDADVESGLVDTVGQGVSGLNGESSNPCQYSCLENSMDRGAWWSTVHGVTKSRTGLSDLHVFINKVWLNINLLSDIIGNLPFSRLLFILLVFFVV